jgi:hypothetical protein
VPGNGFRGCPSVLKEPSDPLVDFGDLKEELLRRTLLGMNKSATVQQEFFKFKIDHLEDLPASRNHP